jgi:LuxR family quorum sensing-dependent transcriptional regulator
LPSLKIVRGGRPDVRLTPRQLECLKWVGEGKSSVDIASILGIAPATVDGHIADACMRLGVRTRIQAIVEVYRRGWLQ